MQDAWAPIIAAFFVAGLVKGIAGLGLPSVSVGILTLVIGLKPALALLLVPSFVTNLWQAVTGGAFVMIVRRTWPMLLTICSGTWAGVALLARLDPRPLSIVLGMTLMGYAAMGFLRPELPHPGRHETWLSLVIGIAHGVVAGMTGSYVPALPFLQALGWNRDVFVQAMGVVFTISTIALAVSMADQRLVSAELALGSAGATLPALAGMWVGQRIRHRMSEAMFKQVLFGALLALGAYIAGRATFG
ncbi:MAG: sulfite exporter TauE/SafE family protein [Hyphomicrobiaceae bacterium]